MKVVLFCGGRGFRLPGEPDVTSKPMTTIGYRPIVWHVMRYYAHFGVRDFVLCLGSRGEQVKNYFLGYNEALSNDFVFSDGGARVELLSTDIQDWNIALVDTGVHTNVGQRLKAVERHLRGEEVFCCSYADSLTDAPLDGVIDDFRRRGRVAAFLSVRPRYSFHVIAHRPDGVVTGIDDLEASDLWVNGGGFIFRNEIFDFIDDGEDLVEEPFQRLIARDELVTYRYDGFWSTLDTLKDLQDLRALHDSGRMPWAPWVA